MQAQDFKVPNITVGAPNDAKGSTVRSSHVSGDGRMTLAPLVNIQKTSRRQNAQGYDAPSKMGESCQKLRKCQDQIKQGSIPSAIWEMPNGWCGRDLKLSTTASVTPLGVDQSLSQSQCQSQSQQIDRTRHRQDAEGVANIRHQRRRLPDTHR